MPKGQWLDIYGYTGAEEKPLNAGFGNHMLNTSLLKVWTRPWLRCEETLYDIVWAKGKTLELFSQSGKRSSWLYCIVSGSETMFHGVS